MDLYLPGEDRTDDDIKEWLVNTSSSKEAIIRRQGKLDVKLPSFETEYKKDIISVLKDMGMCLDVKDLKEMTDNYPNADFSKILHDAKIKLDEDGATAAAVTEVTIRYSAAPLFYEDSDFHCDHPFIYTITETSTGAIFFIGQYTGK